MADIPQDLANALETAGLTAFFGGCTASHQNQYLKWIGEAKRPESRKPRIEKTTQMLLAKRDEENARLQKKKASSAGRDSNSASTGRKGVK